MSKVKDKVEEFAGIAKALPDNLQVACFELLLEHYLAGTSTRPAKEPPEKTDPIDPPAMAKKPSDDVAPDSTKNQQDIRMADLHVKARRFLEKYSLPIDYLSNLFYKEDGVVKPLYEDLLTTRMSESQIRITLLKALESSLLSGDFAVDVEVVRRECTERKCYDTTNFAAHFKNNGSLFDHTYTKDTKTLKLSEDGRKELADIVKELQ